LHVSSEKARLILDQILSTEFDYLLEVEPQPQSAETNSLPDTPSTSTNCLEQEEILFPDFMLDIEPDLFSEFGNVLSYHSMKGPQRNCRESFNPLEDIPSRRTSGELVSIISNEWLEESELSTEIICLDSSSIPIDCIINTDQINALYNPVVGINIISMSLAKHLIQGMTLIPTIKFMRSLSGHIIPSLGILHILPI